MKAKAQPRPSVPLVEVFVIFRSLFPKAQDWFFSKAVELKSAREIGLMRESGKIVAEALRLCRAMAKAGTRTIEINQAVEALYVRYGATPLFKGYAGANPKFPFLAVTCI